MSFDPAKYARAMGVATIPTSTLITLRDKLTAVVIEQARTRAELLAAKGEEFTREEWDTHFEEKDDADAQILAEINSELAAKNVQVVESHDLPMFEQADRFVEWLSPTIEQIDDYCSDHDAIDTDNGAFAVDGESVVEEAGQ
ncbi:hypothetical protein [uncultured Sphingomonas sp.]|uniref:hypothetical protein n=1 Tax=uncultured Sphingomonas sp. TaxID=158754 RepID=UPI002606E5A5|nr:hypothetical protein [uncultured Sphingomonas sp.]